MKKALLAAAAAAMLLLAMIGAGSGNKYAPQGVARLLSQHLEHEGRRPGALERAEDTMLKGTRYILPFSGGELQLFAYPDPDAAARDLLLVEEDGSAVDGIQISWEQQPHFFLRDNVIVLYEGEKTEVLSLLERLCGAQIRGAPVQL